MKWKTLTKDAFPDIMKKENIDFEYIDDTAKRHYIRYRSKAIYIIAIDINHMPNRGYSFRHPKIDDNHFIHMFKATHCVIIDDKTSRVVEEQKTFDDIDSEDCMVIALNDRNLEYCRYKKVEMEDITD